MKAKLFSALISMVVPVLAMSKGSDSKLIYNVEPISTYGGQQVKFIDKTGQCNYYGTVNKTMTMQEDKILGFKVGEHEVNYYKITIARKVCQNKAYDITLYPIPTKRNFDTNGTTLLKAGAEFRAFSSEEEIKEFLSN